MCYIFSCVGWALDSLQRCLTFVFACFLFVVIGLGLVIAVAAGVAYGYNYSMAEFLTFLPQDTAVYMRRGQFYDKPDLDLDSNIDTRRSGNDLSDNLPPLDQNPADSARRMQDQEPRELMDTWSQVKDTQEYTAMLNKYNRYSNDLRKQFQPSKILPDSRIPDSKSNKIPSTETQKNKQNYKVVKFKQAHHQNSPVPEEFPTVLKILSTAARRQQEPADDTEDTDEIEDNIVYKPV